jgi:hypothetical protein
LRFFAVVWTAYFLVVGIYWIWQILTSTEKIDTGEIFIFLIFGFLSSIFVQWLSGSLKNVYLEGNTLLVSNFLKQIRIPLSAVSHVDNPDWSSLRRIRILFDEPTEFGREIVFAPCIFEAKSIAAELKKRIKTDYLSL